jgi:hypothetical protein
MEPVVEAFIDVRTQQVRRFAVELDRTAPWFVGDPLGAGCE